MTTMTRERTRPHLAALSPARLKELLYGPVTTPSELDLLARVAHHYEVDVLDLVPASGEPTPVIPGSEETHIRLAVFPTNAPGGIPADRDVAGDVVGDMDVLAEEGWL